MAEVVAPKRQAVFDRLRRRIETYRKHQSECIPRYNQSFTGLVEQNIQDTLNLKQRFLESKAKRAAKKTEKKIPDNPLQSLHAVTQFVPKRQAPEDHGERDAYGEGPPPPKQQPKVSESLTKFSVEIVQQLEFTTSANNSQISTNVTVKALNTSVKSDLTTSTVSPQPQPPTPRADIVECKQEQEDNPEFVDLEQCAAALEKDAAANGGNSFPGLSELIGDETSDAIITSDAFKDLISEISDSYPFLKDFDFDGGDHAKNQHHQHPSQHQHNDSQCHGQIQQHIFKVEEDSKSNILSSQRVGSVQQGMQQQRLFSSGMDFSKAELSPAAQTLKQMAEQHQHKTQLGMNFNPTNRPSGKPYGDFQYNGNDYLGSPQGNSAGSQQFKPMVSQSPKSNNFVSSDNIKQEVFSAQNSPGVYSPGSGKGNQTPTGAGQPRLGSGFKQQYSPYGSPGAHGSPQYTPRASAPPPQPQPPPPRPPSCPGQATLQINQAQQLHISQAQGQSPIQVSMAQNLCTEMKCGAGTAVSVAAQQGLYMTPSSSADSYCSVSQSQSINFSQPHRHSGHTGMRMSSMPQQSHQQENMMRTQENMMHQQEKMMRPQENIMHQQEKMMRTQENMMHQQEKMMRPQENMMHQQEKLMRPQENMMHQQEKMMHQQEKIMHQQEKMMHAQMLRLPQMQVRPPPPEYKPSTQTLPPLHPSYASTHQSQSQPQPRMSQQPTPVPPSGPMMRPQQSGYMPRMVYTRPTAPTPAPTQRHTIAPEWRHLAMQRPAFHQSQGVVFSSGDVQMAAGQMQQMSHMAQHQALSMQHTNPQMSVNLQMQQSMGGRPPPTSQMSSFPSNSYSQFSHPSTITASNFNLPLPSTNDFSLDFLEQSHFTDQDLLNSLESGASFNLQDIL